MSHKLSFVEETAVGVLFKCAVCNAPIEFMKPGVGEPAATFDEASQTWVAPENPAQWMGPCTPPEPEV